MVKKRHLAVYSDPNNSSPTHKSRVPARNVTREIVNRNETIQVYCSVIALETR